MKVFLLAYLIVHGTPTVHHEVEMRYKYRSIAGLMSMCVDYAEKFNRVENKVTIDKASRLTWKCVIRKDRDE